MNLTMWKCTYESSLDPCMFDVDLFSIFTGVDGVIHFTLKTMPVGGHLNGTLKLPSFHFPREIRMTSSDLEVSKMSHTR